MSSAFRAGIDPELQERSYNWYCTVIAMQVAPFATVDISGRVLGPTIWAFTVEGHQVSIRGEGLISSGRTVVCGTHEYITPVDGGRG